ncbi:MAG: L-seryl-tRNA(Sec) selenium transferase [Anaerolineales bacterium]|nr:L-seryl-tRNA(Sec) selenium transferase [Anaerolineales bacterium]
MSLRNLPSVDRLLAQASDVIQAYGRPLTTQALRDVLAEARAQARGAAGNEHLVAPLPDAGELLARARARLAALRTARLRPVINATGVILHTNLGRAPLAASALAQIEAAARGYSTLEYDLAAGERGQRSAQAEALLVRLTGAEAALVVNNNAAAVLLALTALAQGRAVLIARGQLVEIGGGFRVPDVLKQSGARLVEVGTTNRTHLQDYASALDEQVAVVLRAHHSNFKIIGFATEPSLAELCSLGRPVVDDLGSGALLDTAAYGLVHEPTVQESLAAGAGLVCFSGDKLLGGPQAGLIVGRRALVDQLRRHPLARAVRPDKLCLAALHATLLHYARDEATREIPVWRMLAAPLDGLARRAQAWAAELAPNAAVAGARVSVTAGESTVGGGSLPGETLPTWLLALEVAAPNTFAARLRAQPAPVVARVAGDRVLLDPRTVAEAEAPAMLDSLRAVLLEYRTNEP